MRIKLRNYLRENDILINSKESYGPEVAKIILENDETINNYSKYDKQISRYNNHPDQHYAMHKITELQLQNKKLIDDFDKVVNKFLNELYSKKHIVLFHCCRLMPYEVNDIIEQGMTFPTKNSLKQKINNLNISNSLKEKIIKNLMNKRDLQADECIYFKIGSSDINSIKKYGAKTFLEYWGGETIDSCIVNEKLYDVRALLINESLPKLICVRIPAKQCEQLEYLAEKIILNFRSGLHKVSDTEIVRDNYYELIKIFDFNPSDKVYY